MRGWVPAKPVGDHFTVDGNQTITPYALNLYSDVYQSFFDKIGQK